MPSFDQFETVRELYRSGLYSVSVARRTSGGAESNAVKECRSSGGILGEAQAEALVRVFLERAEVQQKAAAAGKHWAPIHALGRSEGGGFYATDLYPHSAQKLVVGRVSPDGRSLRVIVAAVLAGLRELRDACGRGHGNIKPSNVLFSGGGDAPVASVVLTDPAEAAPPGSDDGPTPAGDLRAVGELIHQLVLLQPFRASTGWPLAPGPGWSRLGGGGIGEAWLELCNRLLDPSLSHAPPAIEEIESALPAAAAPRRSKGLVWAGAAVGLLALGGGAAYFLVPRTPPPPPVVPITDTEWVMLCDDYEQWFGVLVGSEERWVREVKTAFSGDPHLAQVYTLLKGAGADTTTYSLRNITGEGGMTAAEMKVAPPKSIHEPDGQRKVKAAADAVGGIKSLLSPEELPKWAAYKRAADLLAASEARGWTGPANYLRQLTSRIGPRPGVVAAVQALRASGPVVDAIAGLEAASGKLAASDDAVLAKFPEVVAGSTALGAPEPADAEAVRKFEQSVVELGKLATRLTEFVDSPSWRKVDRELFEKDGPAHIALAGGGGVSPDLLRSWLDTASDKRFQLPDGTDPRAAPIWPPLAPVRTAITTLVDTYGLDSGAEGPPARLRAEADRLDAAIQELQKPRWSAATAPDIQARADRLKTDIERLTQEAEAEVATQLRLASNSYEDLKNGLAGRRSIVPEGSRAVNEAWRTQRDVLLAAAEALPTPEAKRRALVKPPETLETFLKGVHAAFPDSPEFRTGRTRDWAPALTAVVLAERERRLAALLREVPWSQGNPAEGYQVPADASAPFIAWCETLGRLAADIAAVEDGLDALYGLNETGGAGERTIAAVLGVWREDPVFGSDEVRQALSPVLVRAAALTQVAEQSTWDTLIASADSGRPAQKLAAWRRLREPGVQLPAVMRSLEDEARVRRDLLAGPVGNLPEGPRREELRRELTRLGEEWWAAQMLRASGAEEIRATIAVRDGAMAAREGELDPRIRYNLLLYELEGKLRTAKGEVNADQEKLKADIAAFSQAARGLPAASAAPVATLLAGLGEITSSAEPPPPDVRSLGPGAPEVGWKGTIVDESTVTFTKAGPPERTLTFRRVEPSGGGPVAYVCAQEVAFSLYFGTVDAAKGWASLPGHLHDDPMQTRTDPRFGPRGWEPRGSLGAGSSIRRARYWLVGTPAVKADNSATGAGLAPYPAGLTAGQPRDDSPMTWVSPEAALYMARRLGCRLPTADEWAAAAAAERGADDPAAYIARAKPNLRDQTWAAYKQHLDGLSLAPQNYNPVAPVGGSFWSSNPDLAPAQSYDDQTLWFWEVNHAAGARFSDLIGNAAELVYGGADHAEALPVSATVAQCVEALGKEPGTVMVIGGSALSPAAAPVDAPVRFVPSADGPYYSDVGFRLAFSYSRGRGPTVVARLGDLLAQPPYLSP